MKKYDIFKDYLSLINSDSEILQDAFNELEMLLQDAKASHDRIEYLQSLARSAILKLSNIPQDHKSPLTKKQLTLIVTKGLVKASRDGDVSSSKLLKFAHSVEGLNAFTDTLAGIPIEDQAECWRTALVVPFDLTSSATRKINLIVADDLDFVRSLFERFINLYKTDIEDGFIDDHLAFMLKTPYQINFMEASDGLEFEDMVKAKLNQKDNDLCVCFVDEDMPGKTGTDAIASISKAIRKSSHASRIKFVSYTQKQNLDISEEIAKSRGADMFFKKTGLDDFYDDIVKIFEHLLLDSMNLDSAPVLNIENKIMMTIIGNDFKEDINNLKEYLNFRYINEIWTSEIKPEEKNNNWIRLDSHDLNSIPVGLYDTSGNSDKLIGCLRLITSSRQSNAENINNLIDESQLQVETSNIEITNNSDEIIIDKFYIDKNYFSEKLVQEFMIYAIALASYFEKTCIYWKLNTDHFSIANKFGFTLVSGTSQILELDLPNMPESVSELHQSMYSEICENNTAVYKTL